MKNDFPWFMEEDFGKLFILLIKIEMKWLNEIHCKEETMEIYQEESCEGKERWNKTEE